MSLRTIDNTRPLATVRLRRGSAMPESIRDLFPCQFGTAGTYQSPPTWRMNSLSAD